MSITRSAAREKGRRGEREVARLTGGTRQKGSGMFDGTNDVVSPLVLDSFGIEVKRRAKLPNILTEALAQAQYATRGSGKKPMVFYREDNGQWMVAAYGQDFMDFVNALAEMGNGHRMKQYLRNIQRTAKEAEELC